MTGPLRILMVTPGYPPLIGGAETHVRMLSEELVRLGHDVAVLTDGTNLPQREVREGVLVLRTSRRAAWREGSDRVPWEESLFGLLSESQDLLGAQRFHIIHGQCQAGVLLAAMLSHSCAQALIASFHETEPEKDPLGESRSFFVYGGIEHDAVIVGSAYFRDQALRYGTPPHKLHQIYMGIETERWSATAVTEGLRQTVRRRLGIPVGAPIVLLLGRFKARKGILEFIEAVRLARARLPELHGVIVGSGNSASNAYRAQMTAAIETAGLSRVVVVADSAFSSAEMPAVVASADVVAQPSHREGLGIAVIEAMAAGKPVIASDVDGLREIIQDGTNGVLVPPRDPHALSEGLLGLLLDKEMADRLAQAGLRRVHAMFSVRGTARDTHRVYCEVLTRTARAIGRDDA